MRPEMRSRDNARDHARDHSHNFTYDARFESMRDYPRKKQLYRSHVDMEKRCEKTKRHLMSSQRVVTNECNRKIQKTQERFTKLVQHTYKRNDKKTSGLLYSYNKWTRRDSSHSVRINTNFDKTFDGNIREILASNAEFDRADDETPIVTCDSVRETKRLKSHRSVSVDNLPTEIQRTRQRGTGHVTIFGIGATCNGRTEDGLLGLERDITSISLNDLQTIHSRCRKINGIKVA